MKKKNFINLNGREIALTDEQVREMAKSLGVSQVKLSEKKVGETINLGKYELVVLEQSGDTAAVILKGFYRDDEKFGSKNKYDGSNVDKLCCDFAKEIADIVGEGNLIEHTVDLTANDGLKCYGAVKRKASLLTADLYRRYVYTLDEHNPDAWWWLATPYSTARHGYEASVICVSPRGDLNYYDFNFVRGVRPFCILNSNIFVS